MSGDKKPPIIKKIIKKGHGGHHGGSWKVAYADFVTALMAFFLVMWLLAISSESGREALADYYNELTLYDAVFNGGVPSSFNEKERPASILEGGCFSPVDQGNELREIDDDGSGGMSSAQVAALLRTTQEYLENLESLPEGVDGGEGAGDVGRGTEVVYVPMPETMNQSERQFTENLQNEIKANLGEEAAEQVRMEKVRGGLRIEIIDQDGHPTFRSSGTALTSEGRALIHLVAERLAGLGNQISVEGHTDAKPFPPGQRMTNWELSTARASALRAALVSAGVAEGRFMAVTGYAATRPLPDTDPYDPVNRRVSIMIWDEEDRTPPPAPGGQPSGGGPAFSPAASGGQAVRPPQPAAPPPQPRPLTREELEQQLIDSVMEKSAAPDLSTVGPAFTPSDESGQ